MNAAGCVPQPTERVREKRKENDENLVDEIKAEMQVDNADCNDEHLYSNELVVGVQMGNLVEALPFLTRLPFELIPVLPFADPSQWPEALIQSPESPQATHLGIGCRMAVILDLDETLVHCKLDSLLPTRPTFTVTFEDAGVIGYVYVRPFARLFLEIASSLFDVFVFTASSQVYADQVLDHLDPHGRCLTGRLYRQHCTETTSGFLKDLRSLGCALDRTVLVDNSPVSLVLCPDNGILVSSWTGEAEGDRELMHLLLLLQECAQHHSVPAYLKYRYGFRQFLQSLSNPENAKLFRDEI